MTKLSTLAVLTLILTAAATESFAGSANGERRESEERTVCADNLATTSAQTGDQCGETATEAGPETSNLTGGIATTVLKWNLKKGKGRK